MDGLAVFLLVAVALAIYFLPAIVASRRNHPNATAILVLNLLLGWSLIGWVVALVWACSAFRTDVTTSTEAAVRACPYCAETIRTAAVKCKHCGSDLAAATAAMNAANPKEIDEAEACRLYGITRDGDHFVFGKYRYTSLRDAVNYAASQATAGQSQAAWRARNNIA